MSVPSACPILNTYTSQRRLLVFNLGGKEKEGNKKNNPVIVGKAQAFPFLL